MKLKRSKKAAYYTLIYIAVASVWIIFSDRLLGWVIADAELLTTVQIFKGLAFVLVTGLIFYHLLSSYFAELATTKSLHTREQKRRGEIEESLEYYLSVSPNVTYILKPEDGKYSPVWVSKNIKKVLGYSSEEAMDPGWYRGILHPEDREKVFYNQSLLQEKKSMAYEYRCFDKKGNIHWIYDSLRITEVPESKQTRAIGNWTDISDLKKTKLK